MSLMDSLFILRDYFTTTISALTCLNIFKEKKVIHLIWCVLLHTITKMDFSCNVVYNILSTNFSRVHIHRGDFKCENSDKFERTSRLAPVNNTTNGWIHPWPWCVCVYWRFVTTTTCWNQLQQSIGKSINQCINILRERRNKRNASSPHGITITRE